MPKYRFNLEDGHFIADRGSHDCIDIVQAQEVANDIADRLVQQRPELVQGQHAIVARDEFGNEVYRAELDMDSIRQRRRVR
jgi:hypothetical protein